MSEAITFLESLRDRWTTQGAPQTNIDPIDAAIVEIGQLSQKLDCGHRKVDMDDSYGGCVFCGFKNGYEEYEAELEQWESLLPPMRAFLWMAQCWNDHNFSEGVIADKCNELCKGLGINSVEDANALLDSLGSQTTKDNHDK